MAERGDTWLRLVGPAMTWPSLRSRRPTWPEAAGRALIYQLRATGSSNDSQGRRGSSRLPRRGVPSATCRQGEGGAGPVPVPAPVLLSASRARPGSADQRSGAGAAGPQGSVRRAHSLPSVARESSPAPCSAGLAALRPRTRLYQTPTREN